MGYLKIEFSFIVDEDLRPVCVLYIINKLKIIMVYVCMVCTIRLSLLWFASSGVVCLIDPTLDFDNGFDYFRLQCTSGCVIAHWYFWGHYWKLL